VRAIIGFTTLDDVVDEAVEEAVHAVFEFFLGVDVDRCLRDSLLANEIDLT
jgi:hypothetical protein